MKILFLLNGDENKASSRVRGYWVCEELGEMGVKTTIKTNSKKSILWSFFYMISFDAVIFQKNYSRYSLLLLKWSKLIGKKAYLDIDDAPSRNNNPKTLKNFNLMVSNVNSVFCGSDNLCNYVRNIYSGKEVLVPTSIKLENYEFKKITKKEKICLGWIGNGNHYEKDLIDILVKPLEYLSSKYKLKLKIVGGLGNKKLMNTFNSISDLEVEIVDNLNWSDSKEVVRNIKDFDIGLYPLLNNDFNAYKCGFKALEYFALKIPVISSPNKANEKIIKHNLNGFVVENKHQYWTSSLDVLIKEEKLRLKMGEEGYKNVKLKFSTPVIASQIYNYIKFA